MIAMNIKRATWETLRWIAGAWDVDMEVGGLGSQVTLLLGALKKVPVPEIKFETAS
jgi:hypothetical protein